MLGVSECVTEHPLFPIGERILERGVGHAARLPSNTIYRVPYG